MPELIKGADRTPHDLGRFVFTCGDIGRLKVLDATPVIAGDSYEADMVGAVRLSALRRGLAVDSKMDICTFYVPHRHTYGEEWVQFMKDGFNAKPLSAVQVTNQPWGAGFLGAMAGIVSGSKVPKWLYQSYINIYKNYFIQPQEMDANIVNSQSWSEDDQKHGLLACHLKNIWTAALPDDVIQGANVDAQGSLDIMQLQRAYAVLHNAQERDLFMRRYRDIMDDFGGKTHYDGDTRPHLLMRSEFWASGYDVDGTDASSLGQFSGRVQQSFKHTVPRFYVPEHGCIMTVALMRFPPIHTNAIPFYIGQPEHDYASIAGDAGITGNMPPRNIAMGHLFREAGTGSSMLLAEGQWLRSVPDHVDHAYSLLDGFPFVRTLPQTAMDAGKINSKEYDYCFQTMQLRHWNAQLKTNVTVYRDLPGAREAVMTAG